MIPNDFGLIRQREHTLISLLYEQIYKNIEEYEIEVLSPEYVNNHYIGSTDGEPVANAGRSYSIMDISKYDYVLAPVSVNSRTYYTTGLRNDSGAFTGYSIVFRSPIVSECSAYAIFKCEGYNQLCVNINSDLKLPVIALRRHRSDGVNPKGIIKDVNSDILQPVKEDELNGEADRIRNDLSGNAESPDLDSKSGAGADERADN